MVRGLDYYNRTVFEIVAEDLGAQNSIGAGGRYDGLTKTIGGPDLPAVGFATGLERVLQTMEKQGVAFPPGSHPLIYFIPMGEKARKFCFEQVSQLRHQGIAAELDLSAKKIQNGLQMANHIHAELCIIIGDQELDTQIAQIKNLNTRQSLETPFAEISSKIQEMRTRNV